MRKTNIRINNFFVIDEDGKYYLSDVDQIDYWKDINDDKLKKNGKDITKKLSTLLDKHEISSNVNFIDFEGFEQNSGSDSDDDDLDGGGS